MSTRAVVRMFGNHYKTILGMAICFQKAQSTWYRDTFRRLNKTGNFSSNFCRIGNWQLYTLRLLWGGSHTGTHRLRSIGLRVRRLYVEPISTKHHQDHCLHWATHHTQWNLQKLQQWHGVIFYHESKFHLKNSDGRLRVWSRHGERYNNGCVVQT